MYSSSWCWNKNGSVPCKSDGTYSVAWRARKSVLWPWIDREVSWLIPLHSPNDWEHQPKRSFSLFSHWLPIYEVSFKMSGRQIADAEEELGTGRSIPISKRLKIMHLCQKATFGCPEANSSPPGPNKNWLIFRVEDLDKKFWICVSRLWEQKHRIQAPPA